MLSTDYAFCVYTMHTLVVLSIFGLAFCGASNCIIMPFLVDIRVHDQLHPMSYADISTPLPSCNTMVPCPAHLHGVPQHG